MVRALSRKTLLQIAAGGAAVVVLGSIGPWATFLGTSISGTEGNGTYTLAGGVLIVLGVWRAWVDDSGAILLGCATIALLVAALGVYHYETLNDLVSEAERDENPLAAGLARLVSPGWGLQAMVLGAVAAMAASLAAWRLEPAADSPRTPASGD